MKTPKVAFILSGTAFTLLIIYLVLLMLFNYYEQRAGDSAIWNISAEDISRVTIKHPGENGDNLIFEKTEEGSWTLSSPAIPYDQALADGLSLSLAYIAAEKEIAVNPSSLSEYGLDEPIAVDVFTKDGAEHKLLLGGKSSSGTSRYFSLDGVTVYTMDEEKAQAINLDNLNVRDKNVLKLNRTLRPRDIAAKITRVSLIKGEEPILEAGRDKDGNWTLNGGESSPEQAATATALSDALARLIADEFIGDGNLGDYQLDVPQYTMEFENENGLQALLLGKLTEDGGSYYACVSGSDAVFTVSRQGFTFLE